MSTFCKATVGEYAGITDLGYVFAKEVPGTLPLQAYWDSTEEDSCASISDEHCPGVVEGTLGYVLDEVATDAWSECGAQETEDRKWRGLSATCSTRLPPTPGASAARRRPRTGSGGDSRLRARRGCHRRLERVRRAGDQ